MPLPCGPGRPRFSARKLGIGYDLPAEGVAGSRWGITRALRLHAQPGEDELGEAVGLLQMRVATENEGVDAEIVVLPHAFGDGIGVSDQRRPRPAADQTDASPEIRAD